MIVGIGTDGFLSIDAPSNLYLPKSLHGVEMVLEYNGRFIALNEQPCTLYSIGLIGFFDWCDVKNCQELISNISNKIMFSLSTVLVSLDPIGL